MPGLQAALGRRNLTGHALAHCLSISNASQVVTDLECWRNVEDARLLRVLAEVDYRGPVGLQSYGLTGDARDNLQASLRAWEILNPP